MDGFSFSKNCDFLSLVWWFDTLLIIIPKKKKDLWDLTSMDQVTETLVFALCVSTPLLAFYYSWCD
jgi:hypothetical protein